MFISIIPEYVIIQIFSFLDKFSIQQYDSAITSKNDRKYYLEIIKFLKIPNPCRWTYLRGIQCGSRQICKINNLNYVSDFCKDLILYDGILRKKNIKLNFENNNIVKLRIDFVSKYIKIINLKGENIEEIFFVLYCLEINNILENISKNCPKLKKITIHSRSNNYQKEYIEDLINDKKIEVKILKK